MKKNILNFIGLQAESNGMTMTLINAGGGKLGFRLPIPDDQIQQCEFFQSYTAEVTDFTGSVDDRFQMMEMKYALELKVPFGKFYPTIKTLVVIIDDNQLPHSPEAKTAIGPHGGHYHHVFVFTLE